ncbi:Clavaminate synthase-like protein [Xylariaceae sp. FL0662B]|nr:Clavaminate synthase-like protein [Xylariaceae sp. FL0662B]
MPSTKLFEGIPAFPDDIPVAQISTISLSGLRAGDAGVAESLLSSAQKLGFFLLDLRNDNIGNDLIEEMDDLFDLSKVVMDLPSDIEQKYKNDPPRSFLGYKAQGGSRTETMEPDRFEWFNLEPMNANLPLLKSFLEHGQDIIQMVCRILATQLNLLPDSFTSLQPPSKPSGTIIRFIKTYACPSAADLCTSMVHHTDFGTITLLANVIGGLQIPEPGKSTKEPDAWSWVRLQPGCLIVNLGDAMVEWTGELVRSNVHRIRYPPGQQRFLNRYSVAILARPERNAIMKNLVCQGGGSNHDEGNLTAWEWEVKKSSALAKGEDTVESKGGKVLSDVSVYEARQV